MKNRGHPTGKLRCCHHRKGDRRTGGYDDSESRIDSIAFSEMINGFLSGLDLEKRSIFVLRYWHLKSISDISKSLDISQSKVKTTLYRLRESLRQYIEREGYML